jgi:MtN3 and saliva related transmembrane protein
MTHVDAVGWAASLILFATVSRQVWKQWKEGQGEGVSRWLFLGQMAASTGFLVYSWLLQQWVFVVSNAFLLLAAIVGQVISMRIRRAAAAAASGPASGNSRSPA